MNFSPERAEIRFGCGLSPQIAPPSSLSVLLAGLDGPDAMADRFPMLSYDAYITRRAHWLDLRKKRRTSSGARAEAFAKQAAAVNRTFYEDRVRGFGQTVLRWSLTDQGLRERLALFWADHFTTVGKSAPQRSATSIYIDAAIRPNLSGRFADLLIAAVTHPMMLAYLDQQTSVGPGSVYAQRQSKLRGLNENLAREVMELHTLGVDGPYTQADVRQLAELFTGLGISKTGALQFNQRRAEPGSESVLGRSYGGDPARLEPVLQVLRDLAVHPATADHIARKLAVHFVSDTPDSGLVDHMAARFLATDGDLRAVYTAMLEHPAAWDDGPGNVKPPFDFVASACRALAVPQDRLQDAPVRQTNRLLVQPIGVMGQSWQRPSGPDGWSEEDTAWVTPQGLSARLRWAMAVPRRLLPELPDPRQFVTDALGATAPEPVRFAARAAETRAEAVGLILSAPAFQRR
ncbi:DUF1800 domain-containing protein [Antarcticimicrobium sediminis]|uniref:DUF1800 domain-containing protein n=1 Tax=Antarcticimicrobium sediminis TaxID=2546227 RepID=A0A4R5EPK9_9RHOB|nr:DUF1800 domain-containing protein [Antarcticimicrobium sediminis]TDE36679.1 DUF1800 domain-containing protein [Antarcticimicrobium sediminis]